LLRAEVAVAGRDELKGTKRKRRKEVGKMGREGGLGLNRE
jgi:hypothetical protein